MTVASTTLEAQLSQMDLLLVQLRAALKSDQFARDLQGNVESVRTSMFQSTANRPLVYEVRFKCDVANGGMVKSVVKGLDSENWYVGFHDGVNFTDALNGVGARLANGAMKFNVDSYPPTSLK